MQDAPNYRVIFLQILAANLPTLRQQLGTTWDDYEKKLRVLLAGLQRSGDDASRIADRIIKLSLSSVEPFARECLRASRELAGASTDDQRPNLKGDRTPSARSDFSLVVPNSGVASKTLGEAARQFQSIIDDATGAAISTDIPLHEAQLANERRPDLSNLNAQSDRVAMESSARVVNLSFLKGRKYVSAKEILVVEREYELRLQIGRPWGPRSIVRYARAIPDQYLDKHSDASGIDLDVCLYTEDFLLERDVFALHLPRSPNASNHLDMLLTPTKSGTGQLRVCIYYQHNLIQSLCVSATVAHTDMPLHEDANFAEVEFSMTDDLLGLDAFPPRALNLLTNDGDGTHKIAIRGTDIKLQYTLTGSTAITDVRKTLLAVCAEVDAEGRPTRYRYSDVDNSGDEAKLTADLKALAAVGDKLYCDLIMDPANWDKQNPLEERLIRPSEIQISITRSTRNVYPWALVYDRRLESGPDISVCPVMLKKLASSVDGTTLQADSCVDGTCPHTTDTKIVCPFGFWGFRHAIEQLPPNPGQVVLNISAPKNLSFIMAVHQQLAGKAHRVEVEKAAGITAQYLDLRDSISTALTSAQPHFVYFYCHGGRSANVPWLGVGNAEKIAPSDFRAWEPRWQETTPIVVVNGCHTVDLNPDDLLDFVKVFAWCRAAGVIGTEIAIPESLGREFGTFFISRFVKGEKVGTILRDFRLALLAKRNVLGLSYSPYCHGDLHLQVGDPTAVRS